LLVCFLIMTLPYQLSHRCQTGHFFHNLFGNNLERDRVLNCYV